MNASEHALSQALELLGRPDKKRDYTLALAGSPLDGWKSEGISISGEGGELLLLMSRPKEKA